MDTGLPSTADDAITSSPSIAGSITDACNDEYVPANERRSVGTAVSTRVCRTTLRNSVSSKRMSLTVPEQSFIDHMLEHGDDDDLAVLHENLHNESIFFNAQEKIVASGRNAQQPTARPPPDSTMKRLEVLEARKNCRKSVQLWREASFKVLPTRKGLGSSYGSLPPIYAIRDKAGDHISGRRTLDDEKKTGQEEDDDLDEDDEDEDDEEYDIDEYTKICALGPHPGEQVRKASTYLYKGQGFEVDDEQIFSMYSGVEEHFDPWIFTETDEEGHKFDFHILGTSHDDLAAHPHVLTPILMNSLQPYLPLSKRGESFWLKYSLVRDGASTVTFLQQLRGSKYTLMAMETVDGEVFGAFVGQPWTIQPTYFGTPESFVWRMKHSRTAGDHDRHHVPGDSLLEQAQKEADIEVFTSQHSITGNDFFQLCQDDRIAIGGGAGSSEVNFGDDVGTFAPNQMGFALTFGEDGYLMHGSSSACLTFHSPPLSKVHADGSIFELVNLEVWGLTPCIAEEEALMMELHNLFLKRNAIG